MLACPNCWRTLPETFYNASDLQPCPSCQNPLLAEVFPAYWAPPPEGSTGETVLVEGESSCFYHAEKRAVVACESCGRFVCALCDVELNGQHLCPVCLQKGARKGKLKLLENKRPRYDTSALLLAISPVTIILLYFCWITAPVSIYLAVKHWRSPGSIVGRSHWRAILAIILALAQIIGFIALIYNIFHFRRP